MRIESLDVHKAQLDLQEATRRDDTFNQMLEINRLLGETSVFPSLMWTWAFDVLRNIYENEHFSGLATNDFVDEAIPLDVTLKQIFDKFWEDVDSLGLTMDHGGEIVEETIRDWMRDNDFLVALDDDGWLDD